MVATKKFFLTIIAALTSATLIASHVNTIKDTHPTTDQSSEAVAFAQTLGVGWNLGNSFDAHTNGVSSETCWGNGPATQQTFDAIKKAGFSSVRIPVTWMGHIGKAPMYTIDKEWMNRVAEVAGYAKKAGLKCIINIHHDGHGTEANSKRLTNHWLNVAAAAKDENVNNLTKQKLSMVWKQIATRFKKEGDWLIFETLNEIHDGKWGCGTNLTDGGAQYRVLNEWNQTCVNAIRSAGGKNTTRYIGIPGYVCQAELTINHLVLPHDKAPNRLLVAVHLYSPWDYAGSGKYSEWGHTGKNVVPDKSGEAEYVSTLKALYQKFVNNGIPVYIGEYGCVHRSTDKAEAFRKYYLEYTCKALSDYKMPLLFWDNGSRKAGDDGFGLIRHDNGEFIANGEEIIRIMVDAWNNADPAYTLESIWKNAPQ